MEEIKPRELVLYATGKQNERTSFSEPSIQQVIEHIRQLDNEVHTGIALKVRHILLRILGGSEGRVVLLVILPGSRMAKLVDATYSGEDKFITIHYEREYDDEDIRTTIPKETAIAVASYLWKNGAFPPGLTWQGDDISV